MRDVYKKLAKKLDSMPQGFPATDDGLELKILRKIFTPEDAETAIKLKPMPETAEQIARRFGKPVEEMRAKLDAMAEKGQIGSFTIKGKQRYMFVPYVLGVYEFQVKHLDEELAGMVEDYEPVYSQSLGGSKPAFGRVIPLNASIKAEASILSYEDMQGMIDKAKSFLLLPCICRRKKALLGEPCSHPEETCLAFSREENAFDYFHHAGRIISREEAEEVLAMTEAEGLVHASYNVQEGHGFVCNCCSCCCGFLRGLKEFEAPYVITSSNFVASIDSENCVDCGICAEERCPMGAIVAKDDSYMVLSDKCLGCGVCVPTCTGGAISLVRRPEGEIETPPKNILDWFVERSGSRWGPLRKMAMKAVIALKKPK